MRGTSKDRGRPVGARESVRSARRRAAAAIALAALMLAALCTTASARPAGGGLGGAQPLANPTITQNPSNVTVEAGQPASFTAAATGATSVEWETSSTGGNTWVTIAGANTTTYSIAATTLSENGHLFRAVFKSEKGSATTKSALLTVTQKPAITKQPVSQTVVVGHEAVFETAASGVPTPTAQWEKSSDGGTTWHGITGAKTSVLKLPNVQKIEDESEYRVVYTNAAGTVTSAAATLHVVEPPTVTTEPSDVTVLAGETASFTSVGTGYPSPGEQWEVSTDGGKTWQAIEGANLHELKVLSATISESGNQYRARFTNSSGTVTSRAAKLTVEAPPSVTAQPEDATVSPGGEATFQAEGTGAPAPTVQWELSMNEGASWSPVGGASSDTLTIANAQLTQNGNEYRAVFANSHGTAASRAATLTVSPTDYQGVGWGGNDRGQTGVGSTESAVPAPTPISGLKFVTAVAAGQRHSLALLAGGTVESWGFNGHGQLGDEGAASTRTPIPVENLTHVTAIAAGGNHSVALLKNGTVDAWGDDESGQLGDGRTVELSEVPIPVKGLNGVTAIAAGQEHTLALLSNGTVQAWGNNEHGQLGNGSTKSSSTPAGVQGLSEVRAIAARGNYSLALLANGTVMAWGSNEHDQLGNGEVVEPESDVPVPVEGLSGVTAIAAGTTHALALLGDGTVVGWGDDREGELGNGARESAVLHPVAVKGLTGVTAIAAGEFDSAALLSNGRLTTWGVNAQGSLGRGPRGEPVDEPSLVTALGMVAGVSAGGTQMIAFGEEQPTVSGIAPSTGPAAGGTVVTISGNGFADASSVSFGSNPATSFEIVDAHTIKATAPAGTGTVDVKVTAPSGASPAKAADQFTYLARPTVSKLSVKGGPATGGTVVTITGTGFVGNVEVHFGAATTTAVTVNSPGSLTVTTPAMESGKLSVTVTSAGGTSGAGGKARFKSAPVITSVSPSSGPLAGGNTVTVGGVGFATAAGLTKFKFGGASAKIVSCESETACSVVVPAGRSLGTVDVTVQANSAKSSPTAGDRYTFE